jgi:hypothetical protein
MVDSRTGGVIEWTSSVARSKTKLWKMDALVRNEIYIHIRDISGHGDHPQRRDRLERYDRVRTQRAVSSGETAFADSFLLLDTLHAVQLLPVLRDVKIHE